ncbi:MAG: polyketide synthase dehydratase domain-containing protein, partial [Pseudomonadota bacterium]
MRGRAVVPAAGFAAMAIEAAADALDNHASRQGQAAGLELTDLQIIAPCAVGDGPPLRSRITIEEDAATLRVDSAAGDSDLWRVHARCGFRALGPSPEADAKEGATTAAEPGWRQIDPDDLYRRLSDLGLAYGPCFRRLQEITTDGLVVRGVIRPGTEGGVGGPLADSDCFALHPAMLDSALHALVALLDEEVSSAAGSEPALPFLPTYLQRLQLYRAMDPGEGLAVDARITRQGRLSLVADLALRRLSDGKPIAQLTGLTLERASRGDGLGPKAETWRTDWIPLPGSAVAPNSGGSVAPISARPAPPRRLAELARRLSHALGPAHELEPAAVLLTEICRAVTPACEGETSVPVAPLSTVVPTLLADAPTRGLEVLAALGDPGGSTRSTPPTGPRIEALRAGCMRAVAALLQGRQGPPARVLAIGFDADALRDLAGLSGMGCVFAADPHLAAGPLNSLQQAPATAPILPDPGGATRPAVDFVLVAAPGGA